MPMLAKSYVIGRAIAMRGRRIGWATIAGRLLFSIGACDDAIKAYNYSPNIDKKSKN
jgi:hypothetical protein